MQNFRTFHNDLHVTDKTIDDTHGLRDSHSSLVLGQSIQSLENSLYLAVSQQLLRKFLCNRLSHRLRIWGNGLTKPPLVYLLRCQGKHRKQFNHYLDNYIGHHRSGRDRRVDFQTLEEIPQAVEEVE